MSTAGAGLTATSQPGSVVRGLRALKAGTYGSFYLISKKMKAYNRMAILGQVVSLLQMLSFLTASNLKWYALTSVSWLRWLSSVVSLNFLVIVDNAAVHLAVFYVALGIVAAFLGLFAFTMYGVITGRLVLWPIRILSAVGALCATELYIPLLSTLLSNFYCNVNPHAATSFWRQAGYSCYQGGHLAQTVIVMVLLAGLIPLAMGFSLLFYDPMMLSRSVAARSHGRADFAFLAVKTVLVIFCSLFPDAIGTWGVVFVLVIGGAVWLGSTLYYMSAVSHTHNRITAAGAAIFLAAAIAVAICQGVGSDGGVLLYVSAPLAFLVGVAAADWRAKSIHYKPLARLRNPIEVGLKVRYAVMEKLYGHYVDKLQSLGDTMLQKAASSSTATTAMDAAFADLDDINAQTDAARRALTKADLADIETIFKASAQRFKTSSYLHVCIASHYGTLAPNRHLEMSHLMHAERCSPAFDIGYLIFAARKRSEDVSGSKGQMSALSRVAFEKHLTDARKNTIKAIQHQVAFWTELTSPGPVDIGKLRKIAAAMTDAECSAEASFTQLLALNAQSLLVLRLYSEFTLRVRNNAEKASILVADAARIEESTAKEHARQSGHTIRMMQETPLDVMSDNTGLITISGAPHSIGMVISANAMACRILGYSKWQLERRNISCIVPSPLQEVHDSFIKCYLTSGEGTVVDYNRALLALHKNGYLVPIIICVREAPSVDANAEFIGLIRPLATNDHHILLTDAGIVKGGTQPSFDILDVEPQFLQTRDVSIKEWVPNWTAMETQLRSGDGIVVCIDNRHARRYRRRLEEQRHRGMDGISAGPSASDLLATPTPRSHATPLARGTPRMQRGDSMALTDDERDSRHGTELEEDDGDLTEDQGQGAPAQVWIKASLQDISLRSGLNFSIVAWTYAAAGSGGAAGTGAGIGGGNGTMRPGQLADSTRKGTMALASPARRKLAAPNGGAPAPMSPGSSYMEPAAPSVSHLGGHERPISRFTTDPDSITNTRPGTEHGPAPSAFFPHPGAQPRSPTSPQMGPAAAAAAAVAGTASAAAGCPFMVRKTGLPPLQPRMATGGSMPTMDNAVHTLASHAPMQQEASGRASAAFCAPATAGTSRTDDDVDATLFRGASYESMAAGSVAEFVPHLQLPHSAGGSFMVAGSEAAAIAAGAAGGPRSPVAPGRIVRPGVPPAINTGARASGRRSSIDSTGTPRAAVIGDGGGSMMTMATSGNPRQPRSSIDMGMGRFPGSPLAKDDETASRASTTDAAGTRNLINKLRRLVGEGDADKQLHPALASLRLTGIIVVVIALVLTAIAVIVSTLKFQEYGRNIDAAADATGMLETALRIGQASRELAIRNAGWIAATESDLQQYNAELLVQTERFEVLRLQLYDHAAEAGLSDIYDGVEVNTTDFTVAPGTSILMPTHHVVSLSEALLEYVAHARAIGALPPANVSEKLASVSYVLAGTLRGSSIHKAVNESSLRWLDVSLSSRDTVTTTLLAIYVALVALLVLVALLALLPVLIWTDLAQGQSLRALSTLPPIVIEQLRKQAMRHLRHLSQEEDDDETEMDSVDSEERVEVGGDGEQGAPQLLQDEALSADGPLADADWSALFGQKLGKSPSRRSGGGRVTPIGGGASEDGSLRSGALSRRSKRALARGTSTADGVKYRRSMRSILVLVAKFCSPLLLIFVFETIVYFYSVQTIQATLSSASVAFAASQRAVLTMDSTSWLRKSLRTTGDPTAIAPYISETTASLNDLEYFHRLLQFGTVPAAPQTTAASLAGSGAGKLLNTVVSTQLATLMSTDACAVMWAVDPDAFPQQVVNTTTVPVETALGSTVQFGTSLEDCRFDMDGVLGRAGYHGAMLEFLSRARMVRDVRAASFIGPSGEGFIPVTQSNGSVVNEPQSLQAIFDIPDVEDIRSSGYNYLARGSLVVATAYQRAATNYIANFVLFESVFCASFLVLCAAWMLGFFVPQVYSENKAIRQQRAILLLLPPQFFRSSPVLKALLASIMLNSSGSAGSKSLLSTDGSFRDATLSTSGSIRV